MDRILVAIAAVAYLWVAFGIKARDRNRRMFREALIRQANKRFQNKPTKRKGFLYMRAKKK